MTHIQQRRDTLAAWTLANPVLMDGEVGHEKDTGRWKLGDGVTPYVDLPYKSGVDSVAGYTGVVQLSASDIEDAAPLVSPTFTGTPKAPTPAGSDDSTRLATTEWVRDRIDPLAPIDSPAFTGNPIAPTPATADDTTSLATTQWVRRVLAENTWKPYNPILGGGWSVGDGTTVGRYLLRPDKSVEFRILSTLGNGFAAPAAGMVFNIPLPCATLGGRHQGVVTALLTDVGSNNYQAAAAFGSNSAFVYMLGTYGSYTVPSAVAPFTWAVGDFIEVAGSYQTT